MSGRAGGGADPRPSRLTGPYPAPARAGFSIWMILWVAVVLNTQGPQNFWWLCNLAQFILLVALWAGNRLLISSQAGTVVLIGLVWSLDLFAALVLGNSPTGITGYMFNPELPLALRATSTYHVWLPLFVLWLLHRRGYDRRGFRLQCVIGSAAIVGGALFGDPERNLNYVTAPFGIEQTWLPQAAWIPLLCVATALLVYLPGHALLIALDHLRKRRTRRRS